MKWMYLKLILLSIFSLFFLVSSPVYARECDDNVPNGASDLSDYINTCQQKVTDLQGQKNTLQSALNVLNSKIRLTQAQISQTNVQIKDLQAEIESLTQVIGSLTTTQDELNVVYYAKVREYYKNRQPSEITLLLSSQNFSTLLSRVKYLQLVHARDRFIINRLEAIKGSYDEQRKTKEDKQNQVKSLQKTLLTQQNTLKAQQSQKQDLLRQTQNSEKKYQDLLARARTELEAIEAVIAGRGQEEEVGPVNQGTLIAKIISGASCNSSADHLHFIVAQNGNPLNPFNYLKSVENRNCSGGGDCSAGDPFNPSGDWDWPIKPVVQLNQGFGDTWAIHNTWVGGVYKFHNGIDIMSTSSNEVFAVKKGKLFRGSFTGSNGCALKYVRVDHDDSDIDTFYLHVNYF